VPKIFRRCRSHINRRRQKNPPEAGGAPLRSLASEKRSLDTLFARSSRQSVRYRPGRRSSSPVGRSSRLNQEQEEKMGRTPVDTGPWNRRRIVLFFSILCSERGRILPYQLLRVQIEKHEGICGELKIAFRTPTPTPTPPPVNQEMHVLVRKNP
jgi:hypothetical protein